LFFIDVHHQSLISKTKILENSRSNYFLFMLYQTLNIVYKIESLLSTWQSNIFIYLCELYELRINGISFVAVRSNTKSYRLIANLHNQFIFFSWCYLNFVPIFIKSDDHWFKFCLSCFVYYEIVLPKLLKYIIQIF